MQLYCSVRCSLLCENLYDSTYFGDTHIFCWGCDCQWSVLHYRTRTTTWESCRIVCQLKSDVGRRTLTLVYWLCCSVSNETCSRLLETNVHNPTLYVHMCPEETEPCDVIRAFRWGSGIAVSITHVNWTLYKGFHSITLKSYCWLNFKASIFWMCWRKSLDDAAIRWFYMMCVRN